MCGRYALGIRAAAVRYNLQEQGLSVDNFPADDEARETYNFPPGGMGLVYRARVADAGVRDDAEGVQDNATQDQDGTINESSAAPVAKTNSTAKKIFDYELKVMKWGLIPFWTKRSPDYSSMLRTINCRDDSLVENRGMWNTMKQRKRCIVVAQGFYEWLKKGPGGKEKVPHFVRRKDSNLMCLAGLWDCVKYEDAHDKLYTYSIITTNSSKQLSFLHDRMPVILDPQSEDMRLWLDPMQTDWTPELQSILKPYQGKLECYPVIADVGKVGNNSPDFIVPVDSKQNKKNIANFFDNATKKSQTLVDKEKVEDRDTEEHEGTEDNAPLPVPNEATTSKRKREDTDQGMGARFKKTKSSTNNTSMPPKSGSSKKNRSATSNEGSTYKVKPADRMSARTPRITKFFAKRRC